MQVWPAYGRDPYEGERASDRQMGRTKPPPQAPCWHPLCPQAGGRDKELGTVSFSENAWPLPRHHRPRQTLVIPQPQPWGG